MAVETQSDASYILNEVIARLRSLESKYNDITEKTLMINKNMVDEYKTFSRHLRLLESEMKDIKLESSKIKEVLKSISSETQGYAKKENLKVLEKYINLLNPMNNLTEEDVRRIIKEVIQSEQQGTAGKRGA